MKKVAIIIVYYSGVKDTKECLESIEKLEVNSYELLLIVVNNGTRERFNIRKGIHVINNDKNLGFSGGNNVGIRYALENGADYVLLLNNDTIVDKNLIQELLKVAESENKIGTVAPKIYFAKGYEFHRDRYVEKELGKVLWYAGGVMDWKSVIGSHRGVDEVDNGQFDKIEQTEFASGCCMLIKRQVFKEVGMFDERYFLYYEDADLSKRIKRQGYTIMYVPKAYLWHKNASATGGSGSTLQDYYITRNRMLFGMRYAPFRSRLALIKESFLLLFRGRHWQKRGIFDYYFGRLGKGSYTI